MKVALVHDWLTGYRGGERCLKSLLELFPKADIHTLLHVPGSSDAAIDAQVKSTSFLQHLPGIAKYYRHFLPLYPSAVNRLDLSGYDLVISVSHAGVKNIRVPSNTLHICYCLTPMRYIWDQAQSYFGKMTPFLWPVISGLRRWDRKGSVGVHEFIAISNFVAARIRAYYGRKARVIYPPVDVDYIQSLLPAKSEAQGQAFLYAGALVPYKKAHLVVQVFNELGEKLWIVGSGPEERKLKTLAKKNIEFFGNISDSELVARYAQARALIFPGTEDFGIVPLECMAAGRPVIGLYDGALKETHNGLPAWTKSSNLASLRNWPLDVSDSTGVFIEKRIGAEEQALKQAILFFMQREGQFTSSACMDQAARFRPERFFSDWIEFLGDLGVGPSVSAERLVPYVKAKTSAL